MNLELEGKKALVTGGSRGIGKAIARELAASGCDVAIFARSPETLELTARELARETGRQVVGIPTDVTSTEAVERSVKEAAQALGGQIHILVNNAAAPGGLARGSLENIKDEDVLADLDTKVMGYLRFARAVAPYMKQQGWGRIVNIGGTSARRAAGNLSAGVRNAGLVNMTKYLAEDLGPFGITANIVHPGTTWTERSGPMYEEQARREGISVEEVKKRVASGNSTKRIVDASEVAFVVAFLSSPRSIAISGEVISASGGAGQAVFH
jgi:NAD(P)-dependent dehydrogenase (short-subunit alcohol dehydrogenase family)